MPLWSPLHSDYGPSLSGSLEALYNGTYTYSQLKKKVTQASKLQDMLYQQCVEQSDFCDVTLDIRDTVMKAHWCVLVGCPYFKALYNFNKNLKKTTADRVKVDFGDGEAMKAAIKYLYTGEATLTMDNVQDYLSAADYLQIADLTTQCSQFLSNVILDTRNCAQIMLMSSLYNLNTYDDAFKYVCGHLPEVLSGNELLDLTESSILTFVMDPTLSYVRREDFFNFLVRWTERDPGRREHFCQLFKALDLLVVPVPFLTDTIRDHPLVKDCPHCWSHCKPVLDSNRELSHNGSPLMDVIIIGGGAQDLPKYQYYDADLAATALYAYSLSQDQWVKMPPLPYAIRKPLMTITEHGKLLVVDSVQNGTCKRPREVLRYCTHANKWDALVMMWPAGEFDFEFHYLVACVGRVFLVASSKTNRAPRRCQPYRAPKQKASELPDTRYHVQLLELDLATGQLSVRFIFYQRTLASDIRVTCSLGTGSPTLNSSMIYVMGSKCFGYRTTNFKNSGTKLFFYDVASRYGQEVNMKQSGISFEPMALGLTKGFLSVRLGKVVKKWLPLKDKKMVLTSQHTIPLPSVVPSRQNFTYTVVHDEVYVFGGKCDGVLKATTTAIKYSFSNAAWTQIAPMPTFLFDAGITRGKLPMDALRCDMHCPHCDYEPAHKRALYDESLQDLDDDSDGDMDNSNYYYDSDSGSEAWRYASPDLYEDEEDWDADWF
ncbi:hypothetical protein ACOMHN_042640 [Nucella lapillus]